MVDQTKIYGDLGAAVSPIGQVPHAIGYPVAKMETNPSGGFNPTTDMLVERLLDATATDLTQNPTGLGIANAIQINFGAAQGGALEPYTLGADGSLTINEAGTYRIKVALQFGRSGAAGVSELLFRVLTNGVQAGRSVAAKLVNSNDEKYFENDNWVNIPAGLVITFEVMRDVVGNNSGGLIAYTPTNEGVGTWNDAPSAALRLERWITAP